MLALIGGGIAFQQGDEAQDATAEAEITTLMRHQFDAIYTFAVVDEDGTLKIDDAYWAGNRSVLVDAD